MQSALPSRTHPPSSGSRFWSHVADGSGGPGAAEPLSFPGVSSRPGAQRAVGGLGAADLQSSDEHTSVASPHRLSKSAGAITRRFWCGRAVETLSLSELLPSAGGEGGARAGAGGGAKVREAGTGGADVQSLRGVLDGGAAEETAEERGVLRGGVGGGGSRGGGAVEHGGGGGTTRTGSIDVLLRGAGDGGGGSVTAPPET